MSSIEPDHGSSEVDGSEKIARGLVITDGPGAKRFELTKEVLDPVACWGEILVINALDFTIGFGWNPRRLARLRQRLKNPLVGLVAFIGQNNRCFQPGP